MRGLGTFAAIPHVKPCRLDLQPMTKPTLSLRKHLIVLLLIKLALILWLRVTYFPRLQDQHQPQDLFPPTTSVSAVKESS